MSSDGRPPFLVQLVSDIAEVYRGTTPGFKLALVAGVVGALLIACFVKGCVL